MESELKAKKYLNVKPHEYRSHLQVEVLNLNQVTRLKQGYIYAMGKGVPILKRRVQQMPSDMTRIIPVEKSEDMVIMIAGQTTVEGQITRWTLQTWIEDSEK